MAVAGYTKIGLAWRKTTNWYVKVGSWHTVKSAYIKVNGRWRLCYLPPYTHHQNGGTNVNLTNMIRSRPEQDITIEVTGNVVSNNAGIPALQFSVPAGKNVTLHVKAGAQILGRGGVGGAAARFSCYTNDLKQIKAAVGNFPGTLTTANDGGAGGTALAITGNSGHLTINNEGAIRGGGGGGGAGVISMVGGFLSKVASDGHRYSLNMILVSGGAGGSAGASGTYLGGGAGGTRTTSSAEWKASPLNTVWHDRTAYKYFGVANGANGADSNHRNAVASNLVSGYASNPATHATFKIRGGNGGAGGSWGQAGSTGGLPRDKYVNVANSYDHWNYYNGDNSSNTIIDFSVPGYKPMQPGNGGRGGYAMSGHGHVNAFAGTGAWNGSRV